MPVTVQTCAKEFILVVMIFPGVKIQSCNFGTEYIVLSETGGPAGGFKPWKIFEILTDAQTWKKFNLLRDKNVDLIRVNADLGMVWKGWS